MAKFFQNAMHDRRNFLTKGKVKSKLNIIKSLKDRSEFPEMHTFLLPKTFFPNKAAVKESDQKMSNANKEIM